MRQVKKLRLLKYFDPVMEIKLIYNISNCILAFILWEIICNIVFSILIDYRVVIVTMISLVIRRLVYKNKQSIILEITVPMSIALMLLFYLGLDNIVSLIMICFLLVIIRRQDNINMIYSDYVNYAKKSLYVILGSGTLLIFINTKYQSYIIKYYFIYLALVIWLLREARCYYNNFDEKNKYIFNIGVVGFTITVSLKQVYMEVLKLIDISLGTVLKVIANLIFIFMSIAFYCIYFVLSKLFGRVSLDKFLKHFHKLYIPSNSEMNQNRRKIISNNYSGLSPTIEWIIKILILVIMMVIAYRIINTIVEKKNVHENNTFIDKDELKERIIKEKKAKKSFKNLFGNFFMMRHYKNQILMKYQIFLKHAFKRDIYKTYMTGLEIINNTKNLPDNNNIRSITNIYNESKFSNHIIERDKMLQFKNDYLNIKIK